MCQQRKVCFTKRLDPQPEILREAADPHVDGLASELNRNFKRTPYFLTCQRLPATCLQKQLLLKLDFDGVRGKTQHWIRDFLRDRSLQIIVDKERSTTGQVISDVSTGVCLSVCPTVILAVQCKTIVIKRLHS